MRSRNEISAGGLVYRHSSMGIEVLIGKDAGYHRWVLPKGLVKKGESHEQAAIREVEEETGIHVRLVAPLGEPETYIYTARGVRVYKSVFYFLMEYISGSETNADRELEAVEWVSMDEALSRLGYQGAKHVVLRAKELLSD